MVADTVSVNRPDPRRTRNIIVLLAASVALMMTGFGIIMPVFARRLGEFGGGVAALGLMTTAFSLSQLIFAPILGGMADRFGRRPFILIGLVAFSLANLGYLVADSVASFIFVRAAAGSFTAGIFPAAMGIVADIVPEQQRARWIGIIMGGYGAGFVFGPVLGGFLYDYWGFAAPFVISAILAFLAAIAAAILVPETRPPSVRHRARLRQRRATAVAPQAKPSFWDALPRPYTVLGTLLFIDFVGSFAFAYIEPQMVFYLYENLLWTTMQFGLVVGLYGLAMVFGQTILGQTSDRIGRRPVILTGILLSSMLYGTLAFIRSFPLIILGSIVAGLGSALIAPAISAFYLDITAEQYRGRVVGIKESVLALGGVLGPLAVVVASRFLSPTQIFTSAGLLVLVGLLLAIVFLREPQKDGVVATTIAEATAVAGWDVIAQRQKAAQAALSEVVLHATLARQSNER